MACIMIVGDSMTQGGDGDWTWRYRLWQWLQAEDVTVKFTGPYTGTQEADEPSPPRPPPLYKKFDPPQPVRANGCYAQDVDPFDSHHYSTWGKQCAQAKDDIEKIVSEHPADLLLVMLGFNDIGWLVSDAKGTLESMSTFVDNARRGNPGLSFAIANIPQRTPMGGREDLPKSTDEYNQLLAEAVTRWTTDQSPIHLVKLREEYDAKVGSYDGLHPNALGDYQLARAFSKTLVDDYKLGINYLAVPNDIPSRSLLPPSNFRLQSSPAGVTATWAKAHGAQGYELRMSVDNGDFSSSGCLANRWDSHWASDGQHYQAQVRSCHGPDRSDWTALQSAVARPQIAAPPTNVQIKSTREGVVVTWDPPPESHSAEIIQYTVFWKDKAAEGVFPSVGGFKHSPALIDELESGHKYDFWMLTWSTAGEGLFGPTQEFTYATDAHDG